MKVLNTFLVLALTILLSSTVTAQWTKVTFPTTENLWKIRFADANTGWIAGHMFIYRTTNGGTSWIPQDSSKGAVFAMEVVDGNTALYSRMSKGIRRTTDGGATWTTVDTNNHYYDDMTFVNSSIGFVCGGAAPAQNVPIIRKTTNGGATWFTVSQSFPKAKYELTGISFANDTVGWTVTYDGFVYKTVNGGGDWVLQDSLGFNSYRDIGFFGLNYGWVIGGIAGTQKMAYTTNGGVTWNHISQGGSSPREVEIIDQTHAWYGGSVNAAPYIGRLDSIGGTWKKQDIPAGSNGVESIDFVNTTVGYGVGSGGNVYKTTNGGTLSVTSSADHPASFALGQNYPNPFNPSTSIQYEVASSGNVRIDVYDLLGQCVGTVVNEMKDPGRYTAAFTAHALSSGMYFYSMQSGNFTSVKRMILVK